MYFEVSGKIPSTNQSLTVANGRLVHSSQARAFRASTELAIDNQLSQHLRVNKGLRAELETWKDQPLFCEIKYHADWITKTGTLRKRDICNLEKLLVDSIFSVMNKNGFDINDAQIYMIVLAKHAISDIDTVDKTVIKLHLLNDFNKNKQDNEENEDNQEED